MHVGRQYLGKRPAKGPAPTLPPAPTHSVHSQHTKLTLTPQHTHTHTTAHSAASTFLILSSSNSLPTLHTVSSPLLITCRTRCQPQELHYTLHGYSPPSGAPPAASPGSCSAEELRVDSPAAGPAQHTGCEGLAQHKGRRGSQTSFSSFFDILNTPTT